METPGDLVLETRDQSDSTVEIGPILFTPSVGEDYWSYRVRVADEQAIIGFPKFSTVGIGFAVEEYWNTNLPYSCSAEEIYEHIKRNRGSVFITRERCIAAVEMIQQAVHADRSGQNGAQA